MNEQWWTGLSNLDPEQKCVLELPPAGRYFVTGPAGCGKTNLLVLRAKYLAKRDVGNYSVLVFNGPLERFLTSNTRHGVDPDKVDTFVSWMQKQYWAVVGAPSGLPVDLEERRTFLCDGLRDYLAKTGTQNLFDTILVDEIQDYRPNEIELLGAMAKNLFLVGDTRQQIYQGAHIDAAIDKVVPKANQIELLKHYRIGHAICRLADRIAKPQTGRHGIFDACCYDETKLPSTVKPFAGTFDDQMRIAAEAITQQLDAYPGEFIGVMCPRKDDVERIAEYLQREFGAQVMVQVPGKYEYFESSAPIVVSSLHNGKGLEFRCVHILVTERLLGMPRNRELIYTGVTRAKTTLSIYYEEKLIGYLADALAADNPPTPVPSSESLFE